LDRAPKFPMPANWMFLLRHYYFTKEQKALDQVIKTLDEIANGGIYDQAGGGFARYSTDAEWLIPHFEKMLYDNGQLVSLYAEAYTVTKKSLYKDVVYQTINWLQREMSNGEGGFYSALDADSEGEEGKFYVWTKKEVENILGKDAELIIDYYNISVEGNWEEEKNILHKRLSDEDFAKSKSLGVEQLKEKVKQANMKFLKAREDRVRPGLDDKVLSGWNGLMLKGLVDAYLSFEDEQFLDLALKNAGFLKANMVSNNRLYRSYKEGDASLDAYLEDYAAVIDGLQSLYQATFDEEWLTLAKRLTDYTIENFYDREEQMFFFTDDNSEKLIARKKEFFDNVIPSSNSIMANNLYKLGIVYDDKEYQEIAKVMMSKVTAFMLDEPGYMSNWAILYSYMSTPTAEIAIVGNEAKKYRNEFAQVYHPNKVVMGTKEESKLPLVEGKYPINDKTTIYVCYNKTCKLPVTSIEEAYKQMVRY
ncbi:MAG: beta-L-arabinofuranosidase domain-containing protein, partial [Bacteroidota bacterium]